MVLAAGGPGLGWRPVAEDVSASSAALSSAGLLRSSLLSRQHSELLTRQCSAPSHQGDVLSLSSIHLNTFSSYQYLQRPQ